MKKRMGLVISIVAICTLLITAYVFYSNSSQKSYETAQQNETADITAESTETAESTAEQTKEFAKDFILKDLNGKVYSLSDYKDKIVILVFWEVRCSYCRKELPILNELNKELENQKDVAILAICSAEKDETVQSFLTANDITLNVPLDPDASVYYAYGTKVIPNNYILNKDGSVYKRIIGPTTKEELLKVIDEIRKAGAN